MSTRVTMQDIADALGLSRNTVSKALNQKTGVPDTTRNMILKKAAELSYKNYASLEQAPPLKQRCNIALFTHSMPSKSHFGSRFLSGFTERISGAGYTLTMYLLRNDEVKDRIAPANFNSDSADGIVCIEMFDPDYCRFVCGLGLPTLFADTFVRSNGYALAADVIMMENIYSIAALTTEIIHSGAKSVGFIGDKNHCQSFYERWQGYRNALSESGIAYNPSICILDDDKKPYGNTTWIVERLKDMREIPNAFVCANDFISISLISALKQLNLSVPDDVAVAGFDDSPEAGVLNPSLTTVAIKSFDMGTVAAGMMLNRIAAPSLPHQITYVATNIKNRESTQYIAKTNLI